MYNIYGVPISLNIKVISQYQFACTNHFDIYFYVMFATHKRMVMRLIPMRNYIIKSNLQVTVIND